MRDIVKCESCGTEQYMVVATRRDGRTIRRRRKCLVCGHRITTYEISEVDFKRLAGK